jgi:hypothetical protein
MLLTEQEFVMPNPHPQPHYDPGQEQEQEQEQDQKQAQLQAQFALQSLESESSNDNDNSNYNRNENSSDNDIDNDIDNKVDNNVDNDVDNKVENCVDNKVNTEVNVDVDVSVDLDLQTGRLTPVIDISELSDVESSIIMPDVVYQTLNGDGNQFNIDQVNNLVDNDTNDSSLSFCGGDVDMDAKAEGGSVDIDSEIGNIAGNAANGVAAHADAALTQSAFNETITQGANIQFNQITMNVAGDDFHDSHDLG